MDLFTIKDGKKLRCGYTTGSCAAAAAKAAAVMVLTGKRIDAVALTTPKGEVLHLQPEEISFGPSSATCAIRKESGDDPDITDGILVYATVEKTDGPMVIAGGPGIGRVTKPGLACAVGDWAINPVPRRMIEEALSSAAKACSYTGGLKLTLSIPGGEILAKKTFNPRLGIVGGLSVLGTSGIVDPMSEQALVDTIHTEMDSRRAAGKTHLLAFFGNYGVDFSRDELGLDVSQRVTISNYVGEMLDYAVYKDFSDVLLIGHIGKLIKVAQGIMNTHSRYADGRTTLLSLEAVFAGASRDLAKTIYDSLTTDEAVRLLDEAGLLTPVMAAVCQKIDHYLEARTHGAVRTGAVLFSNVYGVLGYTSQAKDLLAVHQKGGNSMIHFVGAGPGAVDLITVRGKTLLETANQIIYAGSLVNPELLTYAKKDCVILDSAAMTLEDVIAAMETAEKLGWMTVRLHTGDPSVYGAIREQMDILTEKNIAFDVVPGVSSFCGAAAALKAEYTLPGISQSVIITRMEGRTPVPDRQKIADYAAHQATMVIFLSASLLEGLQKELIRGGYDGDTPAAIVYKASWPDEKVYPCTVATLSETAQQHDVSKTALIVVGKVLGDTYDRSLLYHPAFTHGCRKAEPETQQYRDHFKKDSSH